MEKKKTDDDVFNQLFVFPFGSMLKKVRKFLVSSVLTQFQINLFWMSNKMSFGAILFYFYSLSLSTRLFSVSGDFLFLLGVKEKLI